MQRRVAGALRHIRQRFIGPPRARRVGRAGPNVAEIRELCTERSYERGVDYYRSGLVISARIVGDRVRAAVRGTEMYDVTLAWPRGRGADWEYYCTCPYSYEGQCKHVVAALLHFRDHSAGMAREAKRTSSSVKALLDGAGEGYLREFLAAELAADSGLAERFARGSDGPPVAGLDYYARVAAMFRAEADAEARGAWDGGYDSVDLEGVMETAARFEASGDMAEASRAYRQIASAVSDHMDEAAGYVDYDGAVRTAIAKWASCLDKSGPTAAERRACIGDAFSEWRRGAAFSGEYESAMWSLCRYDGDLEHLARIAGQHVPDPIPVDGGKAGARRRGRREPRRRRRRDAVANKPSRRTRMLGIQVGALERLGRARDIERILRAHARADPAACAMLVRRLAKRGAKAAAARAAAGGLDLFGHDGSIADAAVSVYGRGEQGRVSVLSGLFVRTLDWSYHDQLRRLPGWRRERAAVLARLARDKKAAGTLIEMLVREGMHRRALREIVARNDAETFGRYLEPVAGRYPRAYLAAYGRCVAGMADRASTSLQYSRVGRHLGLMAGVAGGRGVAAGLAAALSARHPRKRALLKALAPLAARPPAGPRQRRR